MTGTTTKTRSECNCPLPDNGERVFCSRFKREVPTNLNPPATGVNVTAEGFVPRQRKEHKVAEALGLAPKSLGEDHVGFDTKTGMVGGIEMGISFAGDLSEDQQRRLLEIASSNFAGPD